MLSRPLKETAQYEGGALMMAAALAAFLLQMKGGEDVKAMSGRQK